MNPDACYFGTKYWCIKVTRTISGDGEIYIHADRVEISSGDLFAFSDYEIPAKTEYGTTGPDYEGKATREPPICTLALARGSWTAFFAASCMDGHAVCADHWSGEIWEEQARKKTGRK